MKQDESILRAALLGYESQLQTINNQVAEVKRRLGQSAEPTTAAKPNGKHTKHTISPEGRARIAAAQRRRWANTKRQG
jgi:hypothetical protein